FQEWLQTQNAYTLHKQVNRKFKRTKIVASSIDEQWQADLVDMKEFEKENDGIKYLLTIIDVLSRYAWVLLLKNKSGSCVSNAMKNLFQKRKPVYFQTDKGKEFYNDFVKQLMNKLNIRHFSTENSDIKCAIVERFNRTLKGHVLQDMVNGYNDTLHRSIKMKPSAVNCSNQQMVFKNLYGYNTKIE
ncbi:uncharacterized protein B4U80_10816, partial [Leptotrombidium deliense]